MFILLYSMLVETTQTPLQNIRYHIKVKKYHFSNCYILNFVQGILTYMHLLDSKFSTK